VTKAMPRLMGFPTCCGAFAAVYRRKKYFPEVSLSGTETLTWCSG